MFFPELAEVFPKFLFPEGHTSSCTPTSLIPEGDLVFPDSSPLTPLIPHSFRSVYLFIQDVGLQTGGSPTPAPSRLATFLRCACSSQEPSVVNEPLPGTFRGFLSFGHPPSPPPGLFPVYALYPSGTPPLRIFIFLSLFPRTYVFFPPPPGSPATHPPSYLILFFLRRQVGFHPDSISLGPSSFFDLQFLSLILLGLIDAVLFLLLFLFFLLFRLGQSPSSLRPPFELPQYTTSLRSTPLAFGMPVSALTPPFFRGPGYPGNFLFLSDASLYSSQMFQIEVLPLRLFF